MTNGTTTPPNYDAGLLDTAVGGICAIGLLAAFLLLCAYHQEIGAWIRHTITPEPKDNPHANR